MDSWIAVSHLCLPQGPAYARQEQRFRQDPTLGLDTLHYYESAARAVHQPEFSLVQRCAVKANGARECVLICTVPTAELYEQCLQSNGIFRAPNGTDTVLLPENVQEAAKTYAAATDPWISLDREVRAEEVKCYHDTDPRVQEMRQRSEALDQLMKQGMKQLPGGHVIRVLYGDMDLTRFVFSYEGPRLHSIARLSLTATLRALAGRSFVATLCPRMGNGLERSMVFYPQEIVTDTQLVEGLHPAVFRTVNISSRSQPVYRGLEAGRLDPAYPDGFKELASPQSFLLFTGDLAGESHDYALLYLQHLGGPFKLMDMRKSAVFYTVVRPTDVLRLVQAASKGEVDDVLLIDDASGDLVKAAFLRHGRRAAIESVVSKIVAPAYASDDVTRAAYQPHCAYMALGVLSALTTSEMRTVLATPDVPMIIKRNTEESLDLWYDNDRLFVRTATDAVVVIEDLYDWATLLADQPGHTFLARVATASETKRAKVVYVGSASYPIYVGHVRVGFPSLYADDFSTLAEMTPRLASYQPSRDPEYTVDHAVPVPVYPLDHLHRLGRAYQKKDQHAAIVFLNLIGLYDGEDPREFVRDHKPIAMLNSGHYMVYNSALVHPFQLWSSDLTKFFSIRHIRGVLEAEALDPSQTDDRLDPVPAPSPQYLVSLLDDRLEAKQDETDVSESWDPILVEFLSKHHSGLKGNMERGVIQLQMMQHRQSKGAIDAMFAMQLGITPATALEVTFPMRLEASGTHRMAHAVVTEPISRDPMWNLHQAALAVDDLTFLAWEGQTINIITKTEEGEAWVYSLENHWKLVLQWDAEDRLKEVTLTQEIPDDPLYHLGFDAFIRHRVLRGALSADAEYTITSHPVYRVLYIPKRYHSFVAFNQFGQLCNILSLQDLINALDGKPFAADLVPLFDTSNGHGPVQIISADAEQAELWSIEALMAAQGSFDDPQTARAHPYVLRMLRDRVPGLNQLLNQPNVEMAVPKSDMRLCYHPVCLPVFTQCRDGIQEACDLPEVIQLLTPSAL